MCVSAQFHREDGFGFGSWKTVPAVPVPRSVPAKTVPTVPVSGSGSVPGPPCDLLVSGTEGPGPPRSPCLWLSVSARNSRLPCH